MPQYVECPYCRRKPIRLRVNGEMYSHRVDTGYFSKGTLFSHCPYSGCTLEETLQGKTALRKRVEDFERRGGSEGAKERFRKRQLRSAHESVLPDS
jgi:hypothetical protein